MTRGLILSDRLAETWVGVISRGFECDGDGKGQSWTPRVPHQTLKRGIFQLLFSFDHIISRTRLLPRFLIDSLYVRQLTMSLSPSSMPLRTNKKCGPDPVILSGARPQPVFHTGERCEYKPLEIDLYWWSG